MALSNKLRTGIIIFCVVLEVIVVLYAFMHREPTVTIYSAKEDIDFYTIITEEMLEKTVVSEKTANELFPKAARSAEDVVGCITRTAFPAKSVIELDPEKLVMGEEIPYAKDSSGNVNRRYFVRREERLVTISLDSVGSLNYTIKKGDFVDVIYTPSDASSGTPYSNVVLQGVKVFDVEDVISESDNMINKKQNVTLVADEQSAVVLVSANRNGIINLALTPKDAIYSDVQAVKVTDFMPDVRSSKADTLDYIKYFVNNAEMTNTNKKKILGALADELGRESLYEIVAESSLDEDLKTEILSMLSDEGK
ncbi:MAG: hypothetical protein K6D96_02635 [Acetatifactor sp.]|nr:hypothetical protein [Acetatifactor sp.]